MHCKACVPGEKERNRKWVKTGTEKEELTPRDHLLVQDENVAQLTPPRPQRKVAGPSLGFRDMVNTSPDWQ